MRPLRKINADDGSKHRPKQEINSLYGQEALYFCSVRIKKSADWTFQWHNNEQCCGPEKQWWGVGVCVCRVGWVGDCSGKEESWVGGFLADCQWFTSRDVWLASGTILWSTACCMGTRWAAFSSHIYQSTLTLDLYSRWLSRKSLPLHHLLFPWQCSIESLCWVPLGVDVCIWGSWGFYKNSY